MHRPACTSYFFGSKILSPPVPAEMPRRDLAIALNGLLPLCRAIPGMTAYAYSLSCILLQPGEWVHTSKGNVYWVVTIK